MLHSLVLASSDPLAAGFILRGIKGIFVFIGSVIAAIVIGNYRHETLFTTRAREAIDTVWEFLAFVLTGVAFLLIGIAISLDSLQRAALVIAWGVVAVLAGRAIVIYGLLAEVNALEQYERGEGGDSQGGEPDHHPR